METSILHRRGRRGLSPRVDEDPPVRVRCLWTRQRFPSRPGSASIAESRSASGSFVPTRVYTSVGSVYLSTTSLRVVGSLAFSYPPRPAHHHHHPPPTTPQRHTHASLVLPPPGKLNPPVSGRDSHHDPPGKCRRGSHLSYPPTLPYMEFFLLLPPSFVTVSVVSFRSGCLIPVQEFFFPTFKLFSLLRACRARGRKAREGGGGKGRKVKWASRAGKMVATTQHRT